MFLIRAIINMIYNGIMTLIGLALIMWLIVEFAF